MLRWKLVTTVMCALVLMAGSSVLAQQDQGGGRQGRGNFDPEQMRQRMAQRMMEQLGMTEEEYKAISPKIEKVQQAQREARSGGGFGGMGGMGGRGGRGGDQAPTTEVGKAMAALRATLEDKASSADTIAQRLAALRAARAKAQENVAAAQKELKELLTQRQEAQMVMMGMLE